MKCDYCNKEITKQRRITNSHHFCNKTCYGKFNKKRNKIKCFTCGKEREVTPSQLKRSKHHYCSPKCQNMGRRGKKHPQHVKKIKTKCDNCGKVLIIRDKLLKRHKHHFCNRRCYYEWNCGSNQTQYNSIKIKCKQCGTEKLKPQAQITRAKNHFCSKECVDKYFKGRAKTVENKKRMLRGLIKKPTNPEKRIIRLIAEKNLPLKYVGAGNEFIGRFNPDFITTNDTKKIIEVFGEAFHDPNKTFRKKIPYYQQEFGRKAYFSQKGYNTLILWFEKMQKMSDEQLVNKINNFVGA